MYRCVCVYIYTCMDICINACRDVCIDVYIRYHLLCIYEDIHTCSCVSMYLCIPVSMHLSIYLSISLSSLIWSILTSLYLSIYISIHPSISLLIARSGPVHVHAVAGARQLGAGAACRFFTSWRYTEKPQANQCGKSPTVGEIDSTLSLHVETSLSSGISPR